MLERLLPRQADNRYRGHKLALWLLAFVVCLKLTMCLNSIFNGFSVATFADGIPLDTYTPAGAHAVVSFLAAWGVGQLALCVVCIVVLARYRTLVPFMLALLLLEHLSRRLVFTVMPIVRTGAPPAPYVNLALLTMMVVGLALSVWNSPEAQG